jgi:hypothetical protein
MHVIRDGRPGLAGPLSQFWLRRDGAIFIVAAGLCWHNAPSTSVNHNNSNSIGIEAENDGRSPWPAVQLDAYHRLCAELCREYGLPASAVKGHKEVNTAKPDPHSINMATFRSTVERILKGEDVDRDDIIKAVWFSDEIPVPWGTEGNDNWQARSVLVNHGEWLRKIDAKLDEQAAVIKKLADALNTSK